ncbi:hypothetical protein QTP86_019111 [Hemibagrus guttatus]|nr:hypothetical protein QTP86_019111 [Hemibagrus guttatus]
MELSEDSKGACAYLRRHWASRQDTPWTECQPIAGHTHTLIHTRNHTDYGQFRDANQPTMHVFGPGEETPEAQGEHANSTHTAEVGIKPPTLEKSLPVCLHAAPRHAPVSPFTPRPRYKSSFCLHALPSFPF